MKVFLKYLGYILVLSSFPRLLPIAVGLFYGESVLMFIITFSVSLVSGLFLLFLTRLIEFEGSKKTLSFTNGLELVALTFIIVSVIGAVSFLPSLDNNFLDALFESVSGFTTTGLSMHSSLDSLPKSLLIWRAETQWVGGLGIVMVFLFIFSRARRKSLREAAAGQDPSVILYKAQGFSQKIE